MVSAMSSVCSILLLLASLLSFGSAHIVLTYPGWRGDNLVTNGTVEDSNGLGWGPNNSFPYGMEWMYPCGGMPTTTNRTLWPVGGGAVSFQPGWFTGHSSAFIYINLGIGTIPPNMSHVMNPVFQIVGPSNNYYNGSVCIPQVPLPSGYTPNIGDNATIQVIEAAQHGASLYGCVDITFADPVDVAEVNGSNCINSSDIGFQTVFTTTSLSGGVHLASSSLALFTPVAVVVLFGLFL